MDIGPSEAETFWTAFLSKLARRGPRGVKLAVSDAHDGIKAAVGKVLNATWQRCRVHIMRNALAHAGKSGRRVVSAFIATAFAQDDAEAAKTRWRKVAPTSSGLPQARGLPGRGGDRRAGLYELPCGEPKWSASSPMRMPSPAWSAPSCSNKTTSGGPVRSLHDSGNDRALGR